jgi:hypothetical protein
VPRAKPSQPAHALLESGHGPRQIEVNEHAGASEADSFAQYVGCNEQFEGHRANPRNHIARDIETLNDFIDGNVPGGDARAASRDENSASIASASLKRGQCGVDKLRERHDWNRTRAVPYRAQRLGARPVGGAFVSIEAAQNGSHALHMGIECRAQARDVDRPLMARWKELRKAKLNGAIDDGRGSQLPAVG